MNRMNYKFNDEYEKTVARIERIITLAFYAGCLHIVAALVWWLTC